MMGKSSWDNYLLMAAVKKSGGYSYRWPPIDVMATLRDRWGSGNTVLPSESTKHACSVVDKFGDQIVDFRLADTPAYYANMPRLF